MEYAIEIYQTKEGKLPFNQFLDDLQDIFGRQKIRIRLARLSLGNFGNCRALKDGVNELKIDFGPGYRVYFSIVGKNKILILFAGSKRAQKKDIEKAKNYLIDFQIRGNKYGKKQKI